jgi:hypothetical protein
VLDEGSSLLAFRKFLDPKLVPLFDQAIQEPKNFALFSSLFDDFTVSTLGGDLQVAKI